MMSSLLVAAALAPAAPVPKDTVPNTTGPAPRVVAVKADGTGVVWVSGTVHEKRKVQQNVAVVENGQTVIKQQEVEQVVSNYVRKSLADFGGKFATADGTPLTAGEATKRVRDGATLLITADNKPVGAGWLRAVHGDTVVMFADGLAHAQFHHGTAPMPSTPAPRLALFCADEKGAVRVPVNPTPANTGNQIYYDDLGNGRVIGRRIVFEADGSSVAPVAGATATGVGADGKKALEEIPFDAYDVTGKLVPRAEALKRLKAGGLVLLAGDTRFPDPEHLKAFRDDILVLASSEFVFPANVPNPYDMPKPAPKAAPAKPGAPVQAAPAIMLVKPAPAAGVILKRVQIAK